MSTDFGPRTCFERFSLTFFIYSSKIRLKRDKIYSINLNRTIISNVNAENTEQWPLVNLLYKYILTHADTNALKLQ